MLRVIRALAPASMLAAAYLLDRVSQSPGTPDAAVRGWVIVTVAAWLLAALLARGLGWEPAGYIAAATVSLAMSEQLIGLAILVVAAAEIWSTLKAHRRVSAGLTWPAASRGLASFSGVFLVLVTVRAVSVGAFVQLDDLGSSGNTNAISGPDIYVFLLDGYGRADTLATFGFDNGPFISALRERGFFVAEHNHSNYTKTWLTLATMFDMRHASGMDLPSSAAPESVQERALSRILNTSRALDVLHRDGYEIVATEDAFPELTLRSANRILASGHLTAFEISLIRESGGLLTALFPHWLADDHRARIRDELRTAAALAMGRPPIPRFVWVHLMTPHPPLVFGDQPDTCFPACSFYTPSAAALRLGIPTFQAAFARQTAAVNSLVLEAVDEIMRASARPPVIVLLSDHGVRYSIEDRGEFFRNFFAALTPGRHDLFPDNAAASDTLAVLLNAYLDAGVPIPDPDVLMLSQQNVLDLRSWPPGPAASSPP